MNLRLFYIVIILFFSSCTRNYYNYADLQEEQISNMPCHEKNILKNIRVALVLGGGGAKGMAHLGVLHELEAVGIPIDLIVGCSAGSIVGALYAQTPSVAAIKPILDNLSKMHLFDMSLFSGCHSLCSGSGLSQFLMSNFKNKKFSELDIPLIVVATDLESGQLVSFNSGLVVPAVHASSALPLFYSPVEFSNHIFVDGGVLSPVPVDVAFSHNPEIIIAVDICGALPESMPTNMLGVARRCGEIQYLANANNAVRNAHFIIKLDVNKFGTFDDSFKNELYEIGRKSAREMIPEILTILEQTEAHKATP